MKQLSLPFVSKLALQRAVWEVYQVFFPLIRFCSIYLNNNWIMSLVQWGNVFGFLHLSETKQTRSAVTSAFLACLLLDAGHFHAIHCTDCIFFPLVLVLSWLFVLSSLFQPTAVWALQCVVKNLSAFIPEQFSSCIFFSSIIAHVGNHDRCKDLSLGCN